MTRWLKQSTSVDTPIGPFLDSTDGITAETALTLTQPDIRLKKNGGLWAQKAAVQTLSHEENGFYEVTLDATDTDTLGLLRLAVFETGAVPVWEDFVVVPANVWDSLFGADKLQVDLTQVNGAAQTATLDTIKAETASILVDTAEIGAAGVGLTALATQASVDAVPTAAEINTEVVDALNVDTYAEPGQGLPAATASLAAKINYLYKSWRNKKTQTATTWSLFADDATTVDQKATVSDDATTATVGEIATGP